MKFCQFRLFQIVSNCFRFVLVQIGNVLCCMFSVCYQVVRGSDEDVKGYLKQIEIVESC